MTTDLASLNTSEQNAILRLCILAAFADGENSEIERAEIQRIAEGLSTPEVNLAAALQECMDGRLSLPTLAAALQSEPARTLAYETAVCLCAVDRARNAAEFQFLSRLQSALALPPAQAATIQSNAAPFAADAVLSPPVIANFRLPTAPAQDAALDDLIKNRAILAGALELMPHTLSTMAIVPVQLRLIYQIGKTCGYDLDMGHAKEFLATAGVGLASQVLEGYVSRMVKHVAHRFVGRALSALVTQAAESALAFATTYALGHTAKAYYAGGRTLSSQQMRDLYQSWLTKGRSLSPQFASQIAQQSGSIKVSDLLPLVRQAA